VVQAEAQTAVKAVYQSQGLTVFQNGLEGKIKLALIASHAGYLEQALQVPVSAQNLGEDTSQPESKILSINA